VKKLREALQTDEILVCSAKDGRGIAALWNAIHEVAQAYSKAAAAL
jgi:putative protein kinase ArgK-like GTPase of G3E family